MKIGHRKLLIVALVVFTFFAPVFEIGSVQVRGTTTEGERIDFKVWIGGSVSAIFFHCGAVGVFGSTYNYMVIC